MLAQSVAAVAPSAAATTIPLLVASVAGGSTVWAIAAAMALALLVATTINQFTKRMAATGSLYTFVSRGLGPAASIITGVAMLVGYGFIAMFALGGSGYYVAILVGRFLPEVDAPVVIGLGVVVAMAAACALVLARGIRVSTRVALLVELVSVVIIVSLIAALLWLRVPQIDWSAFRIDGIAPADFAVGAALALTAFVGFESASTLGVEARRPFANVPRAIIWTVIVSGVLYLLASYSQLAGFAVLGREVAASASPVNDLASAFGVGWLGMLLDVSIAASFLACAIASITALARVLFSMGREGLLPGSFGRTHRRFRTPFVAVVVSVPIIAAVLIVTILLTGGVWEAMEVLIVGAAGGYIVAYALACVAAPVFLWRIGEHGRRHAASRRRGCRALGHAGRVPRRRVDLGTRSRRRRVPGRHGHRGRHPHRPSGATTMVETHPRYVRRARGDRRARRTAQQRDHRARDDPRKPGTSRERGPGERLPAISGRDNRRPSTARSRCSKKSHCGPGVTAREISDNLAMPRATTYRLLNLLVQDEYLVRMPDLRGFALGRKVVQLRTSSHQPRRQLSCERRSTSCGGICGAGCIWCDTRVRACASSIPIPTFRSATSR